MTENILLPTNGSSINDKFYKTFTLKKKKNKTIGSLKKNVSLGNGTYASHIPDMYPYTYESFFCVKQTISFN